MAGGIVVVRVARDHQFAGPARPRHAAAFALALVAQLAVERAGIVRVEAVRERVRQGVDAQVLATPGVGPVEERTMLAAISHLPTSRGGARVHQGGASSASPYTVALAFLIGRRGRAA